MDKLFKKFGYEFVYGGHLLSLGAASIVWTVLLIMNKSGGWPIVILAYLVSQIVYNLDHLSEMNETKDVGNPERTEYMKKTKSYQNLLIMFYVVSFFIITLFTNILTSLLGFLIVLGGVVYTYLAKRTMKNITGFKNMYIAFFWSILGFLVPLHYSDSIINATLISIVFYIFLRWILNSSFFDIKDLKSDSKKNLKTLPVVYGKSKTLQILHLINISSGLLLVLLVFMNIIPAFTLPMLAFCVYGFYYLSKAKHLKDQQLRRLSYIVVDGEYLFWPIAVWLGKTLI